MNIGRRAAIVVACTLVGAACSGGSDESADPRTTTSEAPATTTTEPLTVEEQVEQAYLYSWQVLAEAVEAGDVDRLHAAYDGDAFDLRAGDVEEIDAMGLSSTVDVDHDYTIQIIDATTAVVVDAYVNHSVLIDPATGEPVEEDPNDQEHRAYTVELRDGAWKVTAIVIL